MEIGKSYQFPWKADSNIKQDEITLQIVTKNGDDMGYMNAGKIATASADGIITLKVDNSIGNINYYYKLIVWDKDRNTIWKADELLQIVDNRTPTQKILGANNVIIDMNHIFEFNKPFTVKYKDLSSGTSSIVYSSSPDIRDSFIQLSINKFYTDACEVFRYEDAVGCDAKGEQALTFDVSAVISDKSNYNSTEWISKRKVSLSSKTVKLSLLERTKNSYQIQLVSMDINKQEAVIIVKPVIVN